MNAADGELADLVAALQRIEQRIVELTGGEADAVILPSGQSHLLDAAQRQLREREADQRHFAGMRSAILDALPAHIALLDADGVIIAVNQSWRSFADTNGYHGVDFGVGQNYLRVCESASGECAEEASAVVSGLRQVLAADAAGYAIEYPCHSPDAKRWFRLMVTPVRTATHTGAVVMHVDITERKLAEEALSQSEERFRLLSSATSDAVWDLNVVNREVWWSAGFTSLFGIDLSTVAPSLDTWREHIHPDERASVTAALDALFADPQRKEWLADYRFARSDGSYAHVQERGVVIRDAAGRAVRMVGGTTDVSERIALQERLQQSQHLEAVGQLTGGVAHDFNNLLTVMMGSAELLEEGLVGNESMLELARMITNAAQRGAELTQRLLAVARRQPLEPRSLDVNTRLTEMRPLLGRTLGEHVEIAVLQAADLWSAVVDPGQLENALLNLCLNARDAMVEGGQLTLQTSNVWIDEAAAAPYEEFPPGPYVLISVSDTGIGIAPALLTKVFEPFFTTKERGKGTGLGLSMVYGFAKQSGGHVSIRSELGRGTSVLLYLPRAEQDDATDISAAETDRASARGMETILLVEDEDMVRQYASRQLQDLGYGVLIADAGPAALDIVRSRSDIDLLFTDVVMPGGLSGRMLADEARSLRPGLKVLFTSGYSDNVLMQHGRLSAGVDLLQKPYRRAELARKVREVLDGAGGEAP